MRRAGKFAVLMQDDLDAAVEGNIVVIPQGATQLMLHAQLLEWLESVAYADDEETNPAADCFTQEEEDAEG